MVVLTGAGRSFCAGGDLEWMRAQFAAERAGRIAEARRLALMLQALDTLDKPLIGRVNGAAYGGGVGLMAVCDSVVAAEDARFGLTETRLGLIPATIAPYVVARLGGAGSAPGLLLGAGLRLRRGVALGLVGRVVAPGGAGRGGGGRGRALSRGGAGGGRGGEAAGARARARIDEAVIEATIAQLADMWETPETREGIAAFLEKRPASWVRPYERTRRRGRVKLSRRLWRRRASASPRGRRGSRRGGCRGRGPCRGAGRR